MDRTGGRPIWPRLMAATTALFALRVAGQAVQRWRPQDWLPPFGAWQGSGLDYGVLLAFQLVILAAMTWATVGAWTGSLRSSPGRRRWALGLGALYMAGSIARALIGLAVEGAPAWFSAHISSAFHVVLAGFVLALAGYHSRA